MIAFAATAVAPALQRVLDGCHDLSLGPILVGLSAGAAFAAAQKESIKT
jgi:hypothetical protein